MLTRAITGALFVAAIVAGVYFNSIIALCLFTLIILIGTDEFYGLVKKSKEIKPIRFWGTVSSVVLMVTLGLIALNKTSLIFLVIPMMMLFFTFLIELFRKKGLPLF